MLKTPPPKRSPDSNEVYRWVLPNFQGTVPIFYKLLQEMERLKTVHSIFAGSK